MLQLVGNNGYKFNFKQFPDVAERMMVLAAELATTAGEYKSRCVSYRQGLINRQWESVRIFEVFCSEIQRVGSSSNSLKSL